MRATNARGGARPPRHPALGATSVEFALIALVFFTFVFGIIEVSRLLFVFNTLQEVTRRAAASASQVNPKDADAIQALKRNAIFRTSSGELILAAPVTDAHVRLDYLRWDFSTVPPASWPDSAAQNRQICMVNPHASKCIRFVQARICSPGTGDDCQAVQSTMLVPLVNLRLPLPKAPTIAMIETLGYIDGTPPPVAPPCGCP